MIEICEAIHHAHTLGLQHRDLKPSNIMLDAQLCPAILDFGLSAGDPTRGHLTGTIPYVAPEQLDPSRPIDARTDVYALGVILLRAAVRASRRTGETTRDVHRRGSAKGSRGCRSRSIRGCPSRCRRSRSRRWRRRPRTAYQSALEMAADLRRFLEGRAVLARPTIYATTLGSRVRPHLDHIGEWLRLRLIYPHEAERLRAAYRALDAREDDWIVESRTLSYTQIALYLGAFLLVCGSLFYFAADRWYERRRWRRPPVRGARSALRRPQRRGASPLPEGSQGGRGGVLSRGRRAAAALPADPVSRNGAARRGAGTDRAAVRRRVRVEPSAADHDRRRVRVVRMAGAADANRGAQHGVRGARAPADDRDRLGLRAARVARRGALGPAGAAPVSARRRLRRARRRRRSARAVRGSAVPCTWAARSCWWSCSSCSRSTGARCTTSGSPSAPSSPRA